MSSLTTTVTGQSSGWGALAASTSPEAQKVAQHLALTPARLGTMAREEGADVQHEALVLKLMETIKANESAVLESEKQLSDLRGKCQQVQLTHQTTQESALKRLAELEEMLKQQTAEIKIQEASKTTLAVDIRGVEGRLATLRSSLNQKSLDLQAALARKTTLEATLRNSQASLASNQSQYNLYSSQVSSLRSQITNLEQRVRSLSDSIPAKWHARGTQDTIQYYDIQWALKRAVTATGKDEELERY